MKELIEFIAKSIASQPEMVVVTEEEEEDQIRVILEVDDEDKGKGIGREGRVAQSMRTLLRVVAVKQGYRVTLEIK